MGLITTKINSGEGVLAKRLKAEPQIKELIEWQTKAKTRLDTLRKEVERNPRAAIGGIEHEINGAKLQLEAVEYMRVTAINRAEKLLLRREDVANVFNEVVDDITGIERRFQSLKAETIRRIKRGDTEEDIRKQMEIPLETGLFKTEIRKMKDAEVRERVRKMELRIIANPELGKPMEDNLKGKRSANMGAYRLIYRINGEGKPVFEKYEPRDKVYDV